MLLNPDIFPATIVTDTFLWVSFVICFTSYLDAEKVRKYKLKIILNFFVFYFMDEGLRVKCGDKRSSATFVN